MCALLSSVSWTLSGDSSITTSQYLLRPPLFFNTHWTLFDSFLQVVFRNSSPGFVKDIQISSLDWGGQSVLFCTIIKFWQQKPVSTMLKDLHKVWRTIAQEDLKKKITGKFGSLETKVFKNDLIWDFCTVKSSDSWNSVLLHKLVPSLRWVAAKYSYH